jgi:hypothetical protein
MEEKEGVITDVTGHKLRDVNGGGDGLEFVNPGGVSIVIGDAVIYIEIPTPNRIVRVIKELKR